VSGRSHRPRCGIRIPGYHRTAHLGGCHRGGGPPNGVA
jgi:hypothetical protein